MAINDRAPGGKGVGTEAAKATLQGIDLLSAGLFPD